VAEGRGEGRVFFPLDVSLIRWLLYAIQYLKCEFLMQEKI